LRTHGTVQLGLAAPPEEFPPDCGKDYPNSQGLEEKAKKN
jgi:hypothetical protein